MDMPEALAAHPTRQEAPLGANTANVPESA